MATPKNVTKATGRKAPTPPAAVQAPAPATTPAPETEKPSVAPPTQETAKPKTKAADTDAVTLVKMERHHDPDGNPTPPPHTADVHPHEVALWKLEGWEIAQ